MNKEELPLAIKCKKQIYRMKLKLNLIRSRAHWLISNHRNLKKMTKLRQRMKTSGKGSQIHLVYLYLLIKNLYLK